MSTIPPAADVAAGHYAQKQLLSPSRLVRWTHGSRFETGRALVTPYAGRRLLDYGCGDGTFLALVHDLFPEALGVDVEPEQIADCARRFAGVPGIAFLTTDRLGGPAHDGRYEIVVCMEVLEHCPDDIQEIVLDHLVRVTAPGAAVVVSVPIEIGPPLLAKQAARALVALGGLKEYATRERYRPGELLQMLFAGADTPMPRDEFVVPGAGESSPERVEGVSRATRYTGHKGFNWRRLQRSIERRFTVERRLFSPLPRLGPLLNSQAWFVCRKP